MDFVAQTIAYLENLTMIVSTMPPLPKKLTTHKFSYQSKTQKINPQNL